MTRWEYKLQDFLFPDEDLAGSSCHETEDLDQLGDQGFGLVAIRATQTVGPDGKQRSWARTYLQGAVN